MSNPIESKQKDTPYGRAFGKVLRLRFRKREKLKKDLLLLIKSKKESFKKEGKIPGVLVLGLDEYYLFGDIVGKDALGGALRPASPHFLYQKMTVLIDNSGNGNAEGVQIFSIDDEIKGYKRR